MDCPQIAELSYSDFGRRLRERIAGRRVPLSGSLELTFRCNLRCVHCYVAHGHEGLPGRAELTLPEIRGILDQLADEGCLWLLLTGGEPLVRPDFLDIYTYAKRKGVILTLFTNGTLITPQIAHTLAEWRPFRIEITLYGRTQATYERITGIPGSHARCLHGIDLLLQRGLPLRLKTMVTTLNVHELWDIRAYANHLGVDFYFDALLNAGLTGSAVPLALRLEPEKVVRLEMADQKSRASWKEYGQRFGGIKGDPRFRYVCGAGVTSFHIDPYGKLGLCLMSREPNYDLRSGSFHDGWCSSLSEVRYQPALMGDQCIDCELQALCGQCPGWAKLENGPQEGPVDYLCQVGHLRAQALSLLAKHDEQTIQACSM